ncbi:hypothetical protein TrLO_g2392 [Triparma laevis f. longispina]|uniref:Tyrosine specific protein phosphatases domain-containing protein n=1 Tax=Triparma laevis f. longispina TaxID=1714387 RepID=A0A9W7KYX7_9STRA|nr:hypothetical protein TrLO_g2392 [Triparma laevis f. longispina]
MIFSGARKISLPVSQEDQTDYAEEGRKLLQRVNLSFDGKPERYAAANAIFQHPTTQATLYVGNATAASQKSVLAELKDCRRIVFCQDGDGTKSFQSDPEFKYLDFPIGRWLRFVKREPQAVLDFFKSLFDFLDDELGQGNSVLIHCLAGAHRAGTAGVASLMYLVGMGAEEATIAAKALRPAINPIGSFPQLLGLLEDGMNRNAAR